MKTVFSLLVLTAIVFLTGLHAQPKIEAVGGSTLDLGDTYKGQKAEKIVTIRNSGTDTLRISEVKAQCGCTAAMMSEKDKVLAPHATGKLSISFDTHNYDGKVSKQVYVASNDTSMPRMTINFSANVLSAIDLEPKLFSFDNMKLDSTYTKTMTITNPSPKVSLKILAVECKESMIKVNLMKNELMPGEKTQIQATFTATKTGTFAGAIELTTNHPTQPKMEIRYYAWVNRK